MPTAIASVLVAEQADDSHSNFGWDPESAALVSHPFDPGNGTEFQVGLRLHDLHVMLLGDGRSEQMALEGMSVEQALTSFRSILAKAAGVKESELRPTPLRDYEMPDHPLKHGSAFALDPSALGGLRDWYSKFASVWSGVAEELAAPMTRSKRLSLAPARVWPHHFDFGGLLSLSEEPASGNPSPAPSGGFESIGFGFSPGDETFHAPYLYFNAYPPPDNPPLLESGLAAWNTEGFSGFVAKEQELADRDSTRLSGESAALIWALAGL